MQCPTCNKPLTQVGAFWICPTHGQIAAPTTEPEPDSPPSKPKLFLSYARGDDEPFVRRLYEDLTARGFDVWFDRESMPSRQLTFHHEIRNAVSACDRLILVIGPKAGASDYVTQEWEFAHFVANVCVNPIVRLDGAAEDGSQIDAYALIPDELKKFHAEDFRDDAAYADHFEKLVRQLMEPIPPVGKLVGVPQLPVGFRTDPERINVLRDLLLADLHKPTVVSGAAARTGLQGMGGIGKSVLANAVARHPEVRRAFKDGVYWIPIGQHPELVPRQRQLAQALGGDGNFQSVHEGQEALRELLDGREVLLIIDDVWERAHAEAFNVIDDRSRILLTTRDAGLVTALASSENHVEVSLPNIEDARRILASSAEVDPGDLPEAADQIVAECGRLPLALALCGGMVDEGTSWSAVLEALREHDLAYVSTDHVAPNQEQHENIWKAMDISLQVLPEDQRRRYTELAVFPEDLGANDNAVATLWEHTGGLNRRESLKLLATFARRSLVLLTRVESEDGDFTNRVVLHDVLHHYATGMAEKTLGAEAALHNELLDAYQNKCTNGWATGPNDGYFFERLCHHLLDAGRNDELEALLLDYNFIQAKLDALGPQPLIEDYDLLNPGRNEPLGLIQGAIQLSAHILARDPAQLAGQLHGRMLGFEEAAIRRLLDDAAASQTNLWFRPVTQSLTPPGGPLLRTLDGHPQAVLSVAVTPDGTQAVSVSVDNTLKVWDLDTGAVRRTLQGHADFVMAVAVTPDGTRAVSASRDQTLKVWDLATGAELGTLQGHTHYVNSVAVTPDGTRAVSASFDNTLKVWDLATGAERRTLQGHTSFVTSVAVTPDGTRAISASQDKTLKVWDLDTGACVVAFSCDGWAHACACSPDGRAIVAGGMFGRVYFLRLEGLDRA